MAAAPDDPLEPIIKVQPQHSPRHVYQETYRQKEAEACPCQIMICLNNTAMSYSEPKLPYKHYSVFVCCCNITCLLLLGFPLAFPFMICAWITSNSVKNFNQQNDFVSARTCSCCVKTAIILMVFGGMTTWSFFAAIIIMLGVVNKDYVLELTGIFAVGGVEILLIMLLICLRIVGKIVRRIRA